MSKSKAVIYKPKHRFCLIKLVKDGHGEGTINFSLFDIWNKDKTRCWSLFSIYFFGKYFYFLHLFFFLNIERDGALYDKKLRLKVWVMKREVRHGN